MKAVPIHILHLEDSARDAQYIADILDEQIECEIRRAHNRATFEEAVSEGGFDIVLCDNNLPDYSAFAAVKKVRETMPLTPVLIISGSIGEEEAVKGLQNGATDYLLKGRLERLVPALKRALDEADERRRRQEVEDELRRNEERMRLALMATNDAIWDIDLTNGDLSLNETFRTAYGTYNGPTPREWLISLVHPEDQEGFRESLRLAISTHDPIWSCNHRCRRLDGSWAHVRNRAYLSIGHNGEALRIVGAMQDETAAIEAERGRRDLEARLREAQKMEAIGTLAGGIAHDFNNIVGIILTNAEVAQMALDEEEADVDSVDQCLQEVILASERARDLVRQILSFSKYTDLDVSPLDPAQVVDECMRLFRSSLPPTLHVEMEIMKDVSSVVANATQLQRVILNLCTNSRQAMPGCSGKIRVAVDDVRLDDTLIEHDQAVPPGHYVRISVGDDGPGMPPEVKARVFEPFFTTKTLGKGTGLGLAVVHGVVTGLGGHVVLDSEPGKGTRFDLYLPASDERPVSAHNSRVAAPRGNGERILLVDDDRSVARAHRRILERQGYEVQVLHSPLAVLEALQQGAADFRLLITDNSMPEMSGAQLSEQLLSSKPGLPILMLTGMADASLRDGNRPQNIRLVLEKPVWAEDLCRAVANTVIPLETAPARARILVVDDDAAHLDACARMLRKESFEVHTAGGGERALAMLAHTPVDLVLTDIIMPDKEGIELIMGIRRQYPDVRLVAMSGGGRVAASDLLSLTRKFGALDTLAKPFSRDELLATIRAALKAPPTRRGG